MKIFRISVDEKIYLTILKISYAVFILHMFSGVLLTSVFSDYVGDYSTMMFWLNEIMLSAGQSFSVGIIGSIILKLII